MVSTNRIILTLFTSKSCSLCVDAKYTIDQVRKKIPFDFIQKDIKHSENSVWFHKYKYDIPILHLNDQFLFKHKVKQDKLELVLKKFQENGKIPSEFIDEEVKPN
ncbi:17950_t:CDS:2 [Dentiscutata erythropus]|uniref:Glutaredoxin-like protein n=1 Tax=Dentiscutata erythropus TaxID=1348616 RepID=A0A9N9EEA0_9GLOM|nr:17950_t:CDS:2 [Dentiscutata erythropus]